MTWASTFLALPLFLATTTAAVSLNEFTNVGYSGYYTDIATLAGEESYCCLPADRPTFFSGTNGPLNEDLSVDFRGPLFLKQFAAYYSDNSDLIIFINLNKYKSIILIIFNIVSYIEKCIRWRTTTPPPKPLTISLS